MITSTFIKKKRKGATCRQWYPQPKAKGKSHFQMFPRLGSTIMMIKTKGQTPKSESSSK